MDILYIAYMGCSIAAAFGFIRSFYKIHADVFDARLIAKRYGFGVESGI